MNKYYTITAYFPKYRVGVLAAEPFATNDKRIIRMTSENLQAKLHHCLQWGFSSEIENIITEILSSSLPAHHKLTLLKAESIGMPGLYVAFQNGHTETVMAFVQCILDSSLSAPIKLILLRPKLADGTPGLFQAYNNNHKELLLAFTQCIWNSDLCHLDKMAIFRDMYKGNGGAPRLLAREARIIKKSNDFVIHWSRYGNPLLDFNCKIKDVNNEWIACLNYATFVGFKMGMKGYHALLSSPSKYRKRNKKRSSSEYSTLF